MPRGPGKRCRDVQRCFQPEKFGEFLEVSWLVNIWCVPVSWTNGEVREIHSMHMTLFLLDSIGSELIWEIERKWMVYWANDELMSTFRDMGCLKMMVSVYSYISKHGNLTRKHHNEPIKIRDTPFWTFLDNPMLLELRKRGCNVPVATTTWTIPAGISDGGFFKPLLPCEFAQLSRSTRLVSTTCTKQSVDVLVSSMFTTYTTYHPSEPSNCTKTSTIGSNQPAKSANQPLHPTNLY